MKQYKINEVFYGIQGEGWNAGEPTVFVRFSGCNLTCPWCDTQHEDGKRLTAMEVASVIETMAPRRIGNVSVTFTGGEPTLQLDQELVDGLVGRPIRVETNGTLHASAFRSVHGGEPIWWTVSPKPGTVVTIRREDISELKVVLAPDVDPEQWAYLHHRRSIQPCWPELVKRTNAGRAEEENRRARLRACMAAHQYVLEHPWWRLSLQAHKLIGTR